MIVKEKEGGLSVRGWDRRFRFGGLDPQKIYFEGWTLEMFLDSRPTHPGHMMHPRIDWNKLTCAWGYTHTNCLGVRFMSIMPEIFKITYIAFGRTGTKYPIEYTPIGRRHFTHSNPLILFSISKEKEFELSCINGNVTGITAGEPQGREWEDHDI